jgi:hypothetical protein
MEQLPLLERTRAVKDFLRAIYGKSSDLAIATSSYVEVLKTATTLIYSLRSEVDQLKAELRLLSPPATIMAEGERPEGQRFLRCFNSPGEGPEKYFCKKCGMWHPMPTENAQPESGPRAAE